jgi:hypothetical protein
MALAVDYSTEQTPGSPSDIIFNDDTTGIDVSITQRRIYIQDTAGNYLVPPGISTLYNSWPNYPASLTITIEDILEQDQGCKVVVQWLTAANTVVYDKTDYIGFNCYNLDEDYSLTQNVASNQLLMNDNGFWANKNLLMTLVESGDKAIERASDINAAQTLYDAATEMANDAQYIFNQNA